MTHRRSGEVAGSIPPSSIVCTALLTSHTVWVVLLRPLHNGRVGIACYVAGSMLAVPAAWMLPVEALRRKASPHQLVAPGAISLAPCLFAALAAQLAMAECTCRLCMH